MYIKIKLNKDSETFSNKFMLETIMNFDILVLLTSQSSSIICYHNTTKKNCILPIDTIYRY